MGNSDHVQKKDVQSASTQITHSQLKPSIPKKVADSNQSSPANNTSTSFNFADINVVQPKLTIGEPNDPYEQEADRVASEVVEKIHNGQVATSVDSDEPVQRSLSTVEPVKSLPVQRNGGIVSGTASNEFESQLNHARGGGSSLEPMLQGKLESAMGADFSRVKIHNDGQADRLSRSIQAKAFTTGNDVFFKQGAYNPNSKGGQTLIAHELTHVMQQNSGAVQRQSDEVIQRYLIRNISGRKSLVSEKEAQRFLENNGIPTKIAKDVAKKGWKDKSEIRLAELLQDARLEQRKQNKDNTDDTPLEQIDPQTAEILEAQDLGIELSDTDEKEDNLDQDNESTEHQGSPFTARVRELAQAHSSSWNQLGSELNIDNFFIDMLNGINPGKDQEEHLKGELRPLMQTSRLNPDDMANVYSSICDIVAYLIMAMAVGTGAYRKGVNALQSLYDVGKQSNDPDSKIDPEDTMSQRVSNNGGKGNSFVTNHTNGQGDAYLGKFNDWASANGAGIVQFKGAFSWRGSSGGSGGSHTWVIEKTQDKNFIVYQAYQNEYTLGQMMGLVTGRLHNSITGQDTEAPQEMVQEFGAGQKKSLSEIKVGMVEILANGMDGTPFDASTFEKMFGVKGHDQSTVSNMIGIYFEYMLDDNKVGDQMTQLGITEDSDEKMPDIEETLTDVVDIAIDKWKKFAGKVKGDPLLKRYPNLPE